MPSLFRSVRSIALFSALGLGLPLLAQRDTLFWFAVPEHSIAFANFDRPIVMRITAYDAVAQVTINRPANGGLAVQNVTRGGR